MPEPLFGEANGLKPATLKWFLWSFANFLEEFFYRATLREYFCALGIYLLIVTIKNLNNVIH